MKPTSPERPEKRFKLYELSTEEHYAYYYALAVLDPEHHQKRWQDMNEAVERHAVLRGFRVSSAKDKKRALVVGMARLAEKGILLVERGPEGTYEPAHVRSELIDFDGMGSSFVLANGN